MASKHFSLLLCFTFFIGCIVLFLLYPDLDLFVSRYFYNDGSFFLKDNPLVRLIYLTFAKIQLLYLILLASALVYFHRRKSALNKKYCVFMLACLLLGPGLLVNTLLKDNSVGRPRPVHTVEFGGKETYTPVLRYSGACKRNCSFVSGHAAIGFYLFVLAWVFKSRIWLIPGLALGTGVGFVRIVQGGHFFSDVIFAGWVVFFCCYIVARLMRLPQIQRPEN